MTSKSNVCNQWHFPGPTNSYMTVFQFGEAVQSKYCIACVLTFSPIDTPPDVMTTSTLSRAPLICARSADALKRIVIGQVKMAWKWL